MGAALAALVLAGDEIVLVPESTTRRSTVARMSGETHDSLFAHLESQLRLLGAMVTLAHLDDSRTDELLPAIRNGLDMMTETVDSLLSHGPR